MRANHAICLSFALLSACATADYRIVDSQTGEVMTLPSLAASVADQDVVFLAEEHDNTAAHRTHLALIKELHLMRPELAISLEMFERDVQENLLMYLLGFLDEEAFLADARPWPNYEDDYRPIVEFAKANNLMVIAANVPRPLAQEVSKEGLSVAEGNPHAAREVSAPKDEYWETFQDAMGEHGGVDGEETMFRYYESQCLKDDTMAESIVDYLAEARGRGRDPLVVHVNGRMHSDSGLGTAARVRSRDPDLRVALVGMESVDNVARASVESPSIGDYVLLVKAEPPTPPIEVGPVITSSTVVTEQPAPEGDRPALGFMPDYAYTGTDGLPVGEVVVGGPSEKAGVQTGDMVVEVNGVPVEDIYTYMSAMGSVSVGAEVKVVVVRDGETLNLMVTAGRRM